MKRIRKLAAVAAAGVALLTGSIALVHAANAATGVVVAVQADNVTTRQSGSPPVYRGNLTVTVDNLSSVELFNIEIDFPFRGSLRLARPDGSNCESGVRCFVFAPPPGRRASYEFELIDAVGNGGGAQAVTAIPFSGPGAVAGASHDASYVVGFG